MVYCLDTKLLLFKLEKLTLYYLREGGVSSSTLMLTPRYMRTPRKTSK